jgi:ankyrin repeat protein
MLACRNSSILKLENTIKLLLENENIDPNNQATDSGFTALIITSMSTNQDSTEKTLEMLLNHKKINVNLKDKKGNTALIYSVMSSKSKSSEKTVELLLNHKNIDINLQNNNGSSAIMTCCITKLIQQKKHLN